jgi:hypothetical protein
VGRRSGLACKLRREWDRGTVDWGLGKQYSANIEILQAELLRDLVEK